MPECRPEGVGVIATWHRARRNLFAALPAKLYRAWLAEVRTPFYNSYLANDPALVDIALTERPGDFPKSGIIGATLRDLLGQSIFVTNGAAWARQRRMIDPAFEGGRLRQTFPAMLAAAEAATARLEGRSGVVEMEFETAHAAADVIFRTLFSVPIEAEAAGRVFTAFRRYQSAAPILNVQDLMRLPAWVPRLGRRRRHQRRAAAEIRRLLLDLVEARAAEIAAGTAPDDLATKIMTTQDPETGDLFAPEEMVDQVAIFFLAGHETSASALSWTLHCLAHDPEAQEAAAAEARAVFGRSPPEFADLRKLPFIRDVFREGLRLYPPVPMMVRETARPEEMRGKSIAPGSTFVLSPWHIQRHERLWERPHEFDPWRWRTEAARESARNAFMPFSAGPRVCTGAGFAMQEGVLFLAAFLARFRFAPVPGRVPVPVAQLTVRSETGIWLDVTARG